MPLVEPIDVRHQAAERVVGVYLLFVSVAFSRPGIAPGLSLAEQRQSIVRARDGVSPRA